MRQRRTQQTSILDYVCSNPPKASSSIQTNREAPINFTASYRGSTQAQLAEGDEAGDEVDSEGEGRFDRFRLAHRKTRLDTEEREEPTYGGEASRTNDRKRQSKKKVLAGSESEEGSVDDDQLRKPRSQAGKRGQKDSVDAPLKSSNGAREAIDAIVIGQSYSSSSPESPPKSTASPILKPRRKRSDVVLSGSSRQASTQEQDDLLRTPTQDKPHRDPHSSRKRRLVLDDSSDAADLSDLGRPGPGPSTRSAIKRKTRSDGPVTPPSPLDSGEIVRTRKKTRQVDYYESDDPIEVPKDSKGKRKGKGKAKMTEDPDDAVFEADTSLSPSQPKGRKPITTKRYGIENGRRTRSTRPCSISMEAERTLQPPARPTTKLKIFSSQSEAESEPVMRGWSSTPPADSDGNAEPPKRRRGKVKEVRRKKARMRDPDESEDEIDPKELLEEIALDGPGQSGSSTMIDRIRLLIFFNDLDCWIVVLQSRMRDRTKKTTFERNLARLKRRYLKLT
jgi:hypothetical protein